MTRIPKPRPAVASAKTMSKTLALLLFATSCFGQTTAWFSATDGFTRCAASTVAGSLPKITFYCINANENIGGSYTATLGLANGSFTFGLNNPPGAGITCMVAVNATANPIMVGSFGTVQPFSAAYQCAGTQNGASPQGVWTGASGADQTAPNRRLPVASPKKKENRK